MRLSRRRKTALGAALAGVLLAVLSFAMLAAAPAQATSSTRDFLVTLYGWPDNSPPGNAVAYPKNGGNPTLHDAAGGVGTYANPITFATDKSELPVGTIIYYPYLHRYFIMEDDCTECDEDWTGQGPDGGPHMYHVDLWIGGQGGDSSAVVDCEDTLTKGSAAVVLDPSSDEPVDTTPLFDSADGRCYDPSSFKGGSPPSSSPKPAPSPSRLRATASARPTTRATRPGADPASGPGGGTASPSSTPAAPASASAGSYTAIAGPGCTGSSAARFVGVGYSGGDSDDWNVLPGADGTGSSCSNGFLAMPMSGSATRDGQNRGLWIFDVSSAQPGSCTLRVYVPRPPNAADDYDVDGSSAAYGVFAGASVSGAAQIGQFTVDQAAHRGGSVLEGGFRITGPLLVVRLYDRGIDYDAKPNAMYGVAAIQLDCS